MRTTVNAINTEELPRLLDPTPEHTLILPTRNLVLFPDIHIPIQLGRETSIKLAEFAQTSGTQIGVVCQLDPEQESPTMSDLYQYGVLVRVLQLVSMPNGTKTAIVHSLQRFKILRPSLLPTLPNVLAAEIKLLKDQKPVVARQQQFKVLGNEIIRLADSISQRTFDGPAEIRPHFDPSLPVGEVINNVATHLPIETDQKANLLSINRLFDRGTALMAALMELNDKLDISREMMEKARERMETNNRAAFLRQQIDIIRDELGEGEGDEIDELALKAENVFFSDEVREVFNKELSKLRRFNPQSPDYAVLYTYLETLLSLPWNVMTEVNNDFSLAETTLENDHFGLRKIKDRILEQLAMIINNPDDHAPIICFVGPPGVGKTSLGQSIASALGRTYQRISLGGLHDEAEIRGHRRTYIGAMPGRIIDGIKKAGTSNPVLLLDEIDKIGADFKGDPSSALLEVLDPAQNSRFHDNYVDVDFDLSDVMFIATANTLSTIPRPLLDRIEVIELPGYIAEEKIEIAKRHLLPRLMANQNLSTEELQIPDETIRTIIDEYTSESGVRQLEKRLSSIVRKYVLAKVRKTDFPKPVLNSDLHDLIGLRPHIRDKYEGNDYAGVVTGLAWTEVGGEILLVEASLSPGKGEKITLTGNLGNVMKESATIAMQWIKSNAQSIGIDADVLTKYDVHIHFPEGAVPKDGPSAGITMVTALMSAFTGRKIRERIAMTGEITLRGKVLPVGGIREKILAAKRAGIKEIILSSENRLDIEDIEDEYKNGLTFTFVKDMSEVLNKAVLDELAPHHQ